MGKLTGFKEFDRKNLRRRSVSERIQDWKEIYFPWNEKEAKEQASRCSQCGIPFCQVHCPLHNHIPDWLKLAAEERLEEAFQISSLTNNMPEICGRICPQDRLCEGNCVIEQSGHGTVTIGSIEKYINDTAWEKGWIKPVIPSAEKKQSVGIIGSGPAGLAAAAIKKAGNMVSGARAMAQIASGLAISNKIELQFDGVKRRDFSYTFTFIPKSEQEAQIVEEIVFAFKKNMMPKYVDKMNVGRAFNMKLDAKFNGKIMQVPNIFDIEYHHKGKRNPFLNRVSSSYLMDVTVDYGSDRYKTYESTTTNTRKGYTGGGEGPPPQKTTLTLSFHEIELMSQERNEEGY